MSGLIERIKEGCVYAPKRWSGDCGEMSTVDEVATDALLQEASVELNALRKIISEIATAIGNGSVVSEQASIEFMQEIPKELALYTSKLRSSQMTEEKARAVLGAWAGENDLNLPYTRYYRYTSLQLRAIAWWMDNMGGER